MGTITSGIGLISGINTGQLIDSLIAIDSQPVTDLQNRNTVLQSKETAYQAISAQLLALKLDSDTFSKASIFQNTTANTSNPSVLSATTTSSATPGSYNLTVARLVSTEQYITNGFADASNTPVGAGTLTFEFGDSKLSTDTNLSQLNGGGGVTRGKIRITDQSGASAVVDLSTALTVGDVVNAINNTSGINVTAGVSADGSGLTLTDNTGASTTALAVANVGTTKTATSLGLTTVSASGVLTGSQINTIGASTLLANLNDGNGVRTAGGGANDIQIQRQDGSTFSVSLSGATTVGQVISDINTASGGNVTASVNPSGTGLQLVDSTSGGSALAVTNLAGSQAATDLGLTGAAVGGTLTGDRLIAGLDSRLVKSLKGGAGANLGTINITNRAGTAFSVDLSSAKSVSDVVNLINTAGGSNNVSAAVNDTGTGIALTDSTGAATSNFIVSDASGTGAADLGLAQSVASSTINSGNLQLKYISESTPRASLNGGAGVALGKFTITDSNGLSADVDLSQGNESTVGDILNEINTRGLAVHAQVNANGDGIELVDTGAGTSAITVTEDGSTTAADLGILGTASAPGATLDGSFEKKITINSTDTLTDVQNKINQAGLNVQASILNDGSGANPFRLSLTSTKPGEGGAFVFDDGGLGFGATELVQAQDAAVFFGSSDPSKAVAITSTTNSLTSVVPGATINLLSTSSSPVTLTINTDDSGLTTAVQKFVQDFNAVLGTINTDDSYNTTTQQAGLLLGDSTVETISSQLFNLVNGRDGDLTTRFTSLAQIGITVGDNSQLQFDPTKLTAALSQDRNAVQQLFTFNQTGTDSQGNTITTAGGIGIKISNLLAHVTDSSTGTLTNAVNALDQQVQLNTARITELNTQLAAKKALLQDQFNNMEQTLAQLQQQGNALNGLTSITGVSNSSSKSSSSSSSSSG